MDSLRDALQKAGLKPSPKEKKPYKSGNRKPEPPQKSSEKRAEAPVQPQKKTEDRPAKPVNQPKTSRIHDHHMRANCEYCQKTSPDVEYYQHDIRRLSTNWFCIPCADDLKIHDKHRVTAQSDFSLNRTFRRLYGPTLRISSKGGVEPPAREDRGHSGRYDGNRR